MSIFDLADNEFEDDAVVDGNESNSPVERAKSTDNKDATKAYSERLNADRAKMREELRLEMAQSYGFNTWDEYRAAQDKKIIEDAGFELDEVKPVLDKLVANNPDVIAAREMREAQKATQAKDQESADLLALNTRYGTEFKSIDELDDATKSLISQGVPLVKAYGVEHWDELIKTQDRVVPSKSHLGGVSSTGVTSSPKVLTPEQMKVFRIMNPNASDEDIYKYINKQ